MAVYSCSNLLGCRTLLDWTRISSELPQLFRSEGDISAWRRNQIIYCALQGAVLFRVCVAKYKQQYVLLEGRQELQVLMDFVVCAAALDRHGWKGSLPFPVDKEQLIFSDIPLCDKERLLSIEIPHSDFIVTTEKEMESLQAYYK